MRRAQAVLVAASFSWLLAGTNAVNPLLPLYRSELGFDALLLSLTYVCYVAVLTVFFLVMASPSLVRFAAVSLVAALLLAAGGDLLLWTATESGVLAGRAVSGVAGGLGTGAASALVVVAIGDRGRAITATGNLVGAVLGAGGAQLAVFLLGVHALEAVYLIHALSCLVLGAVLAVVLWLRREANRAALRATRGVRLRWSQLHGGVAPLLCGAFAWVALSISVVLIPSLLEELGLTVSAWSAVVLVLAASAGVQVLSGPVGRIAPWLSGIELIAAGCLILGAAILTRTDWCGVIGVAVTGIGIGITYRLGLVTLTRGAPAARQGTLASLYGTVSYGTAAVTTLLAGFAGRHFGLQPTVLTALVALTVLGAVLLRPAPRTPRSEGRRTRGGMSLDTTSHPVLPRPGESQPPQLPVRTPG